MTDSACASDIMKHRGTDYNKITQVRRVSQAAMHSVINVDYNVQRFYWRVYFLFNALSVLK